MYARNDWKRERSVRHVTIHVVRMNAIRVARRDKLCRSHSVGTFIICVMKQRRIV